MELYQLRTFVAVAEEGHLTRAANRIHASQSTVSAQIKALEDEFGVPLFHRSPKGMSLTPDGETLLARARHALDSADALLESARNLREDLSGTARVGLNSCPDLLRGVDLMKTLKASHPNLELHLLNSMSHMILDELAKGTMDAGFVFGDYPEEFEGIRIRETRMRVAAPVEWKQRLEDAKWENLADMPWITTPPSCPFSRFTEALFPDHGGPLEKAAVVDDEAVLRALVASGDGLAIMREEEALAAEKKGQAVLWPELAGVMPLTFVYPAKRAGERLIAALAGAVRAVWNLES